MDRVFAGLICGCGGAVLAVLVASSLLRLAISIANKIVGPSRAQEQSHSSGGIPEYDWDDWDDEYDAPRPARLRQRKVGAIPEAGVVKCSAILLVTALAFSVGFVVVGILLEEFFRLRMWRDESKLVITIFNLPIAGFTLLVLLTTLLPTTFWRAAMIVFIYGFILLGFLLGIAAIIFVVSGLVR